MVYRRSRRTQRGRRPRRRRPTRARYARPMRRMRRAQNNTQHMQIKRYVQLSGNNTDEAGLWPYADFNHLTTTAESYVNYGYILRYSDIPNYAEYANIYEQYKICGVKIDVKYMSSTEYFGGVLTTGDQALNGINLLLWPEFDDNVVVADSYIGWRYVFEAGRAKIHRYPNVKSNGQSLYIKPGVLVDVFQTGATDQYARCIKSPWLKTGSPNIAHYGFRIMVNASPTIAPIEHKFRLFATYYVKFRYAKGETNA